MYDYIKFKLIYMRDNTDRLQIGHSHDKEMEFKITCRVSDDRQVEVPFSHRHFFYAIYWIHEGSGVHVIDFEEYEIKPNRIFFVKPEQVHFLHNDTMMEYSALQFTEEFMSCSDTGYRTEGREIAVCHDLTLEEQERMEVLFRQINAEAASGLVHSTALIQSEINTLLLDLERIGLDKKRYTVLPDLLLKYKMLIEKRYKATRRVQEYAGQLGVSANYLNVLVRKYLGKSALNLINERVILEIKRRLLRTEKGVSEIAYELGFDGLSYFSRFFKRHTGMTPVVFREKMNEMYQR